MRRFLVSILVAAVAVGCADGGGPDAAVGGDPGDATTRVPATASTVAPTTRPTTTALPTTTAPSPTTTTSPMGMCGDLIPVVTDLGTTCVDPDASTTTTPIPMPPGTDRAPGEPPDLLVAEGTRLVRYELRPDQTMFTIEMGETAHPVSDVLQATDGTVFTRESIGVAGGETRVEFARYRSDGTRTVLDGVTAIHDVAILDGIESVVVGVAPPDGIGTGGVRAWAVADLAEVADLGLEAEAEFGVTHVDWSEERLLGVASAWADLTEWIGFVDVEGGEIDLPSPTDDLAYNAPPYVTAAVISRDGRTLYWVEGPDWGFDPATGDSGPVAAPWTLRGADLLTGDERLAWPLSDPVLDVTILDVHSIDDVGDAVLVNRTRLVGTDEVALAPLILDLATEEPELYEFPAIGIATPLRSLVAI